MFRIFLNLYFFHVWEQYDLTCNGLKEKKSKSCNIRFFFVEAIALQGHIFLGKLFVKNGFRETSDGYFVN